LEIDNLRKVCIYDNSIYLITNTSGFSSNLKHTIYRYNGTLEKIYELDNNFAINKFHIFGQNIFLIGSEVVVVKNADSDRIYKSFEHFSGSNYDVFPYENKVIVSKGNYLYNRQLDLTTKVRESSIDKVNDIIIHPNPATDYIYINLTSANQVEKANHQIMIFNNLGQHVTSAPYLSESERVKIDVSHLTPGVYFVGIGNRTEKFVKW
jgi:hypothetical protein